MQSMWRSRKLFSVIFVIKLEKNKTSLKRHMDVVHLKLKKFKCNSCDFETNLKSDLNDHEKAVHLKIKYLKCDNCDFKCSLKKSMVMPGQGSTFTREKL